MDLHALNGEWWRFKPGAGVTSPGLFSSTASANGWSAAAPLQVDLSHFSLVTEPVKYALTSEYWR